MSAEKKPIRQVRTIEQISAVLEELLAKQDAGLLDAKAADGLNTTIRGIMHLHVDVPVGLLKVYVQSRAKKIDIPEALLQALPLSLR